MVEYIMVSIYAMSPDRDYSDLGRILANGSFLPKGTDCHATKNTWCFRADKSPEEVFHYLVEYVIDPEDQVCVGGLSGLWHTTGKNVHDCYKNPIRDQH